jgi:hypothetical protein
MPRHDVQVQSAAIAYVAFAVQNITAMAVGTIPK